jgi:hypothetical protein
MNRRSWRYGYPAAVAAILLAVLAAAGCQGLLGLGAVIMGTDESAEFAGLKEKKVAVVCRPLVSLQYRNAGAARELAQQVGLFLSANVPKINVIDSQKVASWIDENTWDDYVEVGKALKADCVIGIDLMSFSVLEGQTLYRGNAVREDVARDRLSAEHRPAGLRAARGRVPQRVRQDRGLARRPAFLQTRCLRRYVFGHEGRDPLIPGSQWHGPPDAGLIRP